MEIIGRLNRGKSSRHGGIIHGRFYGCRAERGLLRLIEITFGQKLCVREIDTDITLPKKTPLPPWDSFCCFPFDDKLIVVFCIENSVSQVNLIDIFQGKSEPPVPLLTSSIRTASFHLPSSLRLYDTDTGFTGVQTGPLQFALFTSFGTFFDVNLAEMKLDSPREAKNKISADIPSFARQEDRSFCYGFSAILPRGRSSDAPPPGLCVTKVAQGSVSRTEARSFVPPTGCSAVMLTNRVALLFGGGHKGKDREMVEDEAMYLVDLVHLNRSGKLCPDDSSRANWPPFSRAPILHTHEGYLYILSGYGAITCHRIPIELLCDKIDDDLVRFHMQMHLQTRQKRGISASFLPLGLTSKTVKKRTRLGVLVL